MSAAEDHFLEARALLTRAVARGALDEMGTTLVAESIIPHVDATLEDLREGLDPGFIRRLGEPLPGMLDAVAGPFGLRGEMAWAREHLSKGLAALSS